MLTPWKQHWRSLKARPAAIRTSGYERLRRRALSTCRISNRSVSARLAGWSWQEIADRLGVTKQTVHRKYGRRIGRR